MSASREIIEITKGLRSEPCGLIVKQWTHEFPTRMIGKAKGSADMRAQIEVLMKMAKPKKSIIHTLLKKVFYYDKRSRDKYSKELLCW
jgi:hypothetical protein